MHLTCTVRTEEGASLGVILLGEKFFASGKAGFFGQAKLLIAGRRYQAQAKLVAIGAPGQGEAQTDGATPGGPGETV